VYICRERERESDSMTGLVTALPLLLRGALLGLTRTQRTSTSLPNSLPLAKLFPLSLACSRRLHSVSSSSSPAANSSTTSVIALSQSVQLFCTHTHTHTHTYIYIYSQFDVMLGFRLLISFFQMLNHYHNPRLFWQLLF
jgi:hypothetical protein